MQESIQVETKLLEKQDTNPQIGQDEKLAESIAVIHGHDVEFRFIDTNMVSSHIMRVQALARQVALPSTCRSLCPKRLGLHPNQDILSQTPCRNSFSAGGLLARLQNTFPSLRTRFSTMGASTAEISTTLEIYRVPCLQDNYVWLLKEIKSGLTAIVDASEVNPIVEALEERNLKLDYILNTHHHWDHTGANIELKNKYACTIVGPAADEDRIPGIDVALKENDVWKFGDLDMHVFDTPGHTRGHITLYFPEPGCLFPGDTLFAMGCGRMFEGTAQQMWTSLSKMMTLPPSTRVYCAHEYTQANAKFALAVDSENEKVVSRKQEVDALRAKGAPTLPSTIQEELDTNPFFRASDPKIKAGLGVAPDASAVEAFAAVRTAKDNF